MKSKKMKKLKTGMKLALACVATGWMCWSAGNVGNAQTPSSFLSPDLQEVVKLSQSRMSDDVILNYIKSSGKSYKLNADDIIYLSNQGVSQGVISALQTASSANPNPPPIAPPPTTPPSLPLSYATPAIVETPVVSFDYFHNQLMPYGIWVNVPGYGLCWQPSVDPGWRPYYVGGSWVYSDAGWYWRSDYSWGDIAFHYGRWTRIATGWVWVPGYDYAPAWVVWRHADADGYVGWAPLPPGAVFVSGGWVFNGIHVGISFDFGLDMGFFTFVAYDHFWEHDFRRFIVPQDRFVLIYRNSRIENRYRLDHGRFINEGLSRDRMAVLTHRDVRDIRPMAVHDLKLQEEKLNIRTRTDDLHNFKPGITKPNAMKIVEPLREVSHNPDPRPLGPNRGMTPVNNLNAPKFGGGLQPGTSPSFSTPGPNPSAEKTVEPRREDYSGQSRGKNPGSGAQPPRYTPEPKNNLENFGEGLKNTPGNSSGNPKGPQSTGGNSQAGGKGGGTDSKEKKDSGN